MGKKRKKEKKGSHRERPHTPIVRDLRSAAEPVIRLASSPIVAELVASALVAGAGALARSPDAQSNSLAESADQDGREAADLASLVAYSIAIVAGEIASRLATAYEARVGGDDVAEQVAMAARQAANSAWDAFAADRH